VKLAFFEKAFGFWRAFLKKRLAVDIAATQWLLYGNC